MFKKLARITDQNERLEIYNLLKWNIDLSTYLAEFFSISMLISGLAWIISQKMSLLIKDFNGAFWVSSFLSIALMLLVVFFIRLIFLIPRSQLQAAFGLDSRNFSQRLSELIKTNMKFFFVVLALCIFLFFLLVKLQIFAWTVVTLILVCGLMFIYSYFPFFQNALNRRIEKDELPEQVRLQLENWSSKSGLNINEIFVTDDHENSLGIPRLIGIGKQAKILIGQRTLKEFNPQQLLLFLSFCIMGALINAPLKIALLRMCTVAVGIPVASLLISVLGVSLWGYPVVNSPALVSLILMAAWLGKVISVLAVNAVRRSLSVHLGAAACILLNDEIVLPNAIKLLADKKLENKTASAWKNIFSEKYAADDYAKRLSYQIHIIKFKQQ